MAVNFCWPELRPRIVCDKVTIDDHDVTNLISSDARQKSSGFLCENFVRPPVNVTFHFPFSIEIEKIIVNSSVRAHKSCGLEIFTHSFKERKQSWLLEEPYKNKASDISDLHFVSVGRTLKWDQSYFCFINKNYKVRNFGKRGQLPSTRSSDVCTTVVMQTKHMYHLNNVSHVTVRIFQTARGSVPCLKSVEIWGQPALRTPAEVLDRVFDIAACISTQSPLNWSSDAQNCTNNDRREACESRIATVTAHFIDGVDVPSDFVDPITCEVMSQPVLLPSGHTIDQVTLDKHIKAEEKWGRTANDPFTGVNFTNDVKPVVNSALKARLDVFLLRHGHQLKSVARTLRSSTDVSNKFVNPVHLKRTYKLDTDAQTSWHSFKRVKNETNNSQAFSSQNTVNPNSTTRFPTVSSENDIRTSSNEYSNTCMNVNTMSLPSPVMDLAACDSSPVSCNANHEANLQQSLDTALGGALAQLPSFTRKRPGSDMLECLKNQWQKHCFLCRTQSQECIYALPCGSCVCRACLTKEMQNGKFHCANCNREHLSRSIVKMQNST